MKQREVVVRPSTKGLVRVSILVLAVWSVGAVVSIVAGWPDQFGGSGDPNNVAGEFVARGTATAPPLVPIMVLLLVFILLALSRRWWGTLGVVGLCLLAVFTFIGSLGEAGAPYTPDVPRAVLVTPAWWVACFPWRCCLALWS